MMMRPMNATVKLQAVTEEMHARTYILRDAEECKNVSILKSMNKEERNC